MDKDLVIGLLLIAGGVGFITYLILWSRKAIERIADKDLTSIRDIIKELNHGGKQS